jgi:hypothetical protein
MIEENQAPRSWILRTSLIILCIAAIVLALIQFGTIANTDADCDLPLRKWLLGTGTILLFSSIPVLFIESCLWPYLKSQGMFYYKAVYCVIGSFLCFWTATGLFMLLGDNQCASSFEDGYDAFVGTIGAYFLLLTIFISFFSLANALEWFETEKNPYQPV